MINNRDIIRKAHELGFDDIGFTTAEPFEFQHEVLEQRKEDYHLLIAGGLDLLGGINPKNSLPDAKSIIVLIDNYFRHSFPRTLEGKFGRCYQDDDRRTKDGLQVRIKAFRSFLGDEKIESKIPSNLSQRLSAARAGMGNFGKNSLFYSNTVARKSSWVVIFAVVVDREFEPGEPTYDVGCPQWCRNTCIAACPTGAIKAPQRMDPRRCISYLSYYGEGLTPLELREPMGMWVYGCDVCQNVCPRNHPWLAEELAPNEHAAARAENFDLSRLLHMDIDYYRTKIWPHMFYMPIDQTWRWKMNAARAMGNSRDPKYIKDLERAYKENEDERVRGMCAWALGRISGPDARTTLEKMRLGADGAVLTEITGALGMF